MAPINPPTYLQNSQYSARLDRLHTAALLTPEYAAGPLAARPGVIPSEGYTGMRVDPRPTPDMWVRVRGGSLVIRPVSPSGGIAVCHNDADVDVPIAPAHSSLPRVDRVAAQLYDAADDAGTLSEWQLVVVEGTPASVPVAPPATYAGQVPLAEVSVPAQATAVTLGQIVDVRQFAVAAGGILPANYFPGSAHPGMGVWRYDQKLLRLNDGSRWAQVFDDNFGFPYGMLGHKWIDAAGGYQQITAKSESSSAAVVTGSALAFTMPANVPPTRRLRITLSHSMLLVGDGTSAYGSYSVWLDGEPWVSARRYPTEGGDPATRTRVTYMPPVTAGNHTLQLRAWVVNSSVTTPDLRWTVGELAIELV